MHEAQQFLQKLDSTTERFLFVTISERSKETANRVRHLYGTFADLQEELEQRNTLGSGIFVTVNKTVGNRRRIEDVEFARAIWQEDDTGTDQLPDLEPHIVVETSPNHFHRYWLHPRQTDLPKWERCQLQMVRLFDSDPGAKDRCRVMRLPGFINHKRGTPFDVKIISLIEKSPYEWSKLEDMCQCITDTLGEEPQAGLSTIDNYLRQIRSGEHLHTPIRAIMMVNANKGQDVDYNRLVCLGLIHTSPNEDKKRKALADLDSMLSATYSKISSETAAEDFADVKNLVGSAIAEIDIDWPPGLLGQLAKTANEFFVIPNKPVAILTALALIAGVAGRRYNISDIGLNMYTTVMMPTGSGKDSIRKFVSRVLRNTEITVHGASFIGSRSYTGPKALHNTLAVKCSCISVVTEAGFMYKSEAGDKDGLTAMTLAAYSSSGQHNGLDPSEYSHQNDTMPYLHSPALTLMNEGTPISLQSELNRRDSISTGELPRMWLFNFDKITAYPNRYKHKLNLSQAVVNRLKELISECFKVQSNERVDAIEITEPTEFIQFETHAWDRARELLETDSAMSAMWTRAAQKTLTVSAICAVMNSPSLDSPEVTPQDWAWAKSLHDYEFERLPKIFRGDHAFGPALIAAMQVIHKLLTGDYKGPNHQIHPAMRERGIFTESTFKQASYNRPAIVNLETRYGAKPGWSIILEYMQAQGFIDPVPKGGLYAAIKSRSRPEFTKHRGDYPQSVKHDSPNLDISLGKVKKCWRVTKDFEVYLNEHVDI